jgi:hypothetical protein
MANRNVNTRPTILKNLEATIMDEPITTLQIDCIEQLMYEIGTAANTMLEVMGGDTEDNAVVLLECMRPSIARIGWMSDKVIGLLGGGPGAVGDAEDWLLGAAYRHVSQRASGVDHG